MVHWMRKHRRAIWIVVAIIIVPSFVVWGGSRGSRNKRQQVGEGSVVASVGGIPITRAEFQRRLYQEADMRARYGGDRPTLADLAADGTAERVLNSMVDSRLLELEIGRQKIDVSREYLIEQLKEEKQFKDDRGNFSSAKWNEWIKADRHRDWNSIYAQLREQLAQKILMDQIMAPARVLDSELRKEFIKNATKIQVKYVVIDPPIVPSEEQIKAQYDKDPAKYQIPELRNFDFVAISLTPPRPALVDEIMTKLKNGEDFGGLAQKYSKAKDASDNGHMGWIPVQAPPPENMKGLFETPVGQFTEPVFVQSAFYIFRNNDERTDDNGQRSIDVSEIMIPTTLDPTERAARMEKANDLIQKAKQSKDLKSAAAAAGLKVETATDISKESEELPGVPAADMPKLREMAMDVPQGEISEVVEGNQNLYVAQTTQVTPAVIQPLDAVRSEVTNDAAGAIRYSSEYRSEMKALADKIGAEAKSLQEIVDKFPQYKPEIKESQEFGMSDMLVDQGIYVPPSQIFNAISDKEIGAFVGPLVSLRTDIYFFELVKKTPPTEEEITRDFPKQEVPLRRQALQAKRNQLVMDYVADLREKAERANLIQKNWDVITEMLKPASQETEEENAGADTGTAPATQTAPPATNAATPAAAAEAPVPADKAAEPPTAGESAPADKAAEPPPAGESAPAPPPAS